MRLPLALLALAALGLAREAAEEEEEAAAGRFTAAGRLRCGWALRWAAGAVELRVSCGPARSCAYRGEPRSCPAYGGRRRQFWRQILGRLRRRRPHPCAPGGPLSARLCGPDRAPPEAQLRLLPDPAGTPATAEPPTTAGTPSTAEPPTTAGSRCPQRWDSLCSFILGFWEG